MTSFYYIEYTDRFHLLYFSDFMCSFLVFEEITMGEIDQPISQITDVAGQRYTYVCQIITVTIYHTEMCFLYLYRHQQCGLC